MINELWFRKKTLFKFKIVVDWTLILISKNLQIDGKLKRIKDHLSLHMMVTMVGFWQGKFMYFQLYTF